MKSAAVLTLLSTTLAASAGNTDVIVLVHGFFGWGPTELLGFNYWGGVNSIQKELQAAGHDVRIGVCGPVSSNWDRAAELYAYIKGGTVDYGEVHAKKFGHKRYGRTFPGIYPEWGSLRTDGSVRKIHLVGHSMGGQTIRMLLHFLADGDATERQQAGSDVLFQGGMASWVHSLTTVNAPHDGATSVGSAIGPFVSSVAWPFFKGICAINGVFGDDTVYDFKLDQFGLERRSGEGFLSYAGRIENASVWAPDFKDFSAYDLSLAGAREMNAIAQAQPNVYYFSYATIDTEKTYNPLSKCQVPQFLMWEFLKPMAYLMGCNGDDASWWASDGVVNTISQNGPKAGSNDIIVPWAGDKQTLKPGVWNYMGARDGVDHLENVGMGVQKVEDYYKGIVSVVAGLPAQTTHTESAFTGIVV